MKIWEKTLRLNQLGLGHIHSHHFCDHRSADKRKDSGTWTWRIWIIYSEHFHKISTFVLKSSVPLILPNKTCQITCQICYREVNLSLHWLNDNLAMRRIEILSSDNFLEMATVGLIALFFNNLHKSIELVSGIYNYFMNYFHSLGLHCI